MLQLEYFIKTHSAAMDALDEYLFERVGGRTRLKRILDLIMERDPALLIYWGWGAPKRCPRW
jgi:hypothetical protein